ncbi:hypothetical protein CBS101457_001379 [Exobasidium rhododendri]|nr:hypothetical protein CBS101457_001379 [Exobasidium rhododendri]
MSGVESPLPSTVGAVHSAAGKHQRERERRIMPARLRRVSNLLAGSTIEDELSGTNSKLEAYLLPPTMPLALNSFEKADYHVIETSIFDIEGDYFSEQDIHKASRSTHLIETPEFRTRDDTEMMGKTRTIRSEEDTSDAAYERRHRKPDNLEKKQRRLEKERLVRDRRKLKERIDQLKLADPRLLMPILTAREQQQRHTEGDALTPMLDTASPRGAEAAYGLGKQNMSAEAAQTLSKLELLRTELLEEAHDTLKRYDALLTVPTEAVPPIHATKRKAGENDTDEGKGAGKSGRSISLSGAFANKKIAGGRKSASALQGKAASDLKVKRRNSAAAAKSDSPSASKRLSLAVEGPKSPLPFKPEDGTVRAENTYANIHARTSGGRFAPKSALSGEKGSTSKINTKGKVKPEGQVSQKKRSSSKVLNAARARTKESVASASRAIKSMIDTAPSSDTKPRRVKIVINKKDRGRTGAAGATGASSSSLPSSSTTTTPFGDTNDAKEEDDDGEESTQIVSDSTPQRAARSALTLEEAQALLAKAMEDDDDDDEVEWEVKREDPNRGEAM